MPPEPEPEPAPSPEGRDGAAFREKCFQLFEEDKFPYALTLARALARKSPEDKNAYIQLAYAADDPALEKNYKYTEIQQVFQEGYGEKFGYDALGLSAYLRMFFSSDARMEAYYGPGSQAILDQNLLYSLAPSLKDALFLLHQAFQKVKRGFDRGVLNALQDSETHQQQMEQCAKRAEALLNSRLTETHVDSKLVKGTIQDLFGPESSFHQILTGIQNQDPEITSSILNTMRPFLAGGELPASACSADDLSITAMEAYANDVWSRQKSIFNKNDKLKGAAKNTIVNRMAKVISTAITWAVLCGDSQAYSDTRRDARLLDEFRPRLQALLGEAEDELREASAESGTLDGAALAILRKTIQDLLNRLGGGYNPNWRQYFYLCFLYGNRVELDGRCIPYLEEDFAETEPYNICKRIVKASQDPEQDWDTVLRRIFEPEKTSDGCDYGSAQLIQRYLEDAGGEFSWPPHYSVELNIPAVRAKIGPLENEFFARLEMADNYEWVAEANRIDEITADMERRKLHYEETCNFGFYFRTMDAYLEILQRSAESRKQVYQQRLASLRSQTGEEWPIFRSVEEMIGRQMYAVAQDYMDRVEKEQCREVPENNMLTAETTELTKFISGYSALLSGARDAGYRENKLPEVFVRAHRGDGASLVRNGRDMLESWPFSNGNPDNSISDKLRKLFDSMRLTVASVNIRSREHCFLTFAAPEIILDYPHPIGAYGTEMLKNGLNVFLLSGIKDAVTMNTEIRRLINAAVTGPSVILADTTMSLSDRRKLAQKIKTENQNLTPYLILDRVMILHLANQPQSERWNVFLKCALPFHYLNPYTENSVTDICPEMFIGRRSELEQVIDPGGANIIYGGRQLGKTALLRRASKLVDNRSGRQWSIYLDIKQETAASAAVRIYQRLQDERLLPPDSGAITWPELARKLVNEIKTRQIRRFLLLLDEADNFLSTSAESKYLPIECLERIQTESDNRFKFVLAGLHNVMKFHEQSVNSNLNLPKLGAVTIKPLPFREASELLERPLSYLGFRLKKENTHLIAQILSSTNYYPGLIQFYASRLVSSVGKGGRGDVEREPPYELKDAQILTLLKDQGFQDNIREKFMITLGIDQEEKGYYRTLAYVLAYCCFQDPEQAANGCSVQTLYQTCTELDLSSITALSLNQVQVLLDELIDLNVLRKKGSGEEATYIFNRISFRHMLGDKEQVENVLVEIMVNEAERR